MCRDVTCVQHPRVVIDLQPSPYIPSDDEGVTRPTEHLFSTPEWIRRAFFPLPIPSKISPSVSPISYICRLTLLNDTRHAKFHSRKRSFAFLYPPVTNRISIHTPNIKKDFSPRIVDDHFCEKLCSFCFFDSPWTMLKIFSLLSLLTQNCDV